MDDLIQTITIAKEILAQGKLIKNKPEWYKNLLADVRQILIISIAMYENINNGKNK